MSAVVAERRRPSSQVSATLAFLSVAEDCFIEAGAISREQDALFWELRAALSLARLRVQQSRPREARQILAPVCERFTEGPDTTDLRVARSMLEALQPV